MPFTFYRWNLFTICNVFVTLIVTKVTEVYYYSDILYSMKFLEWTFIQLLYTYTGCHITVVKFSKLFSVTSALENIMGNTRKCLVSKVFLECHLILHIFVFDVAEMKWNLLLLCWYYFMMVIDKISRFNNNFCVDKRENQNIFKQFIVMLSILVF